MKKTKVKIPAKLNLTLDVLGREGDYHKIMSLCTTVNIYDKIIIRKRKDNKITLRIKGIDCGCNIEDNNAYKACKLFVDRFSTRGVDIILKKNIPLACGMGGSSADIAGVLLCMQKLFNKNVDIVPLANELGSDSSYMISGGYAVIYDRGDNIIPVRSKIKIPTIIITDEKTLTSKQGYAGYDEMDKKYEEVTLEAVSRLINKKDNFFDLLKNDLQPYAETVIPELKDKIKELVDNGAETALMTGSGSAVYGLFMSKMLRDKVYKDLKQKYPDHVFKCKTF